MSADRRADEKEAENMNEIHRMFYDDTAEKKRIARSYRNKNRKGKGRIRFSFENMSPRERKELNGPVMEYNMRSPMQWKAFKKMPRDLRGEYLQGVVNQFHPTQQALADMFAVSKSTLIRSMNDLGIECEGKGKDSEEWRRWIGTTMAAGEDEYDSREAVAEEASDQGEEDAVQCEPDDACSTENCEDQDGFEVRKVDDMVVNATPSEIAQLLTILCGTQRRVVRISFGDSHLYL